MIDGTGQARRIGFLVSAQPRNRRRTYSDLQDGIGDHHCSDVDGTRAVRTRSLFVRGSRLRRLPRAMRIHQVRHRIHQEITGKDQQCESCKKMQKSIATHFHRWPPTDMPGSLQVNRRRPKTSFQKASRPITPLPWSRCGGATNLREEGPSRYESLGRPTIGEATVPGGFWYQPGSS